MSRLKFIDLAKGIAIVLVVAGHAEAVMTYDYYYADHIRQSLMLMFSIAMPLFFMVSAIFLRSRLDDEAFSDLLVFKKILYSRFKLFLSLSFLFFIINLLAPESMGLPSANNMLMGMFLMQSNPSLTPSHTLWFLFVLAEFSFLTFFFVRILRLNICVIFIISLAMHMYVSELSGNYYFAINKIAAFYLYFVFGYMFSGQISGAAFFRKNSYLIALFVLWILMMISANFSLLNRAGNFVLFDLGIKNVTGSLFVIGLCWKLQEVFSLNKVIEILHLFGKRSLFIYVFHAPTIFLLRKIFFGVDGFDNSLTGSVVLISMGILLPLVYGKIISYNPTVHRLLFGYSP